MERINPYKDHRLEITCRNQQLVIRKKEDWRHNPEVIELYEDRVKPVLTGDLIPRQPIEFHVRYYWNSQIAYTVVNPDIDAGWPAPAFEGTAMTMTFRHRARQWLRDFLRDLLSQRRRNSSMDLLPLLRCTVCHSTKLTRKTDGLNCASCRTRFPVRRGLVAMNEGQKVLGTHLSLQEFKD